MRRQMRFTAMIVVQILSSVISIAAAIMMAWFWRGSDRAYMALVWMRVIQVGAYTAGIWVLCPWVPSPPARGAGVRSMLMYGADVTGFNIINYFSRNLDNVLIGKFCGPGPLGFYAKAYQIVLFPLANIRTPIVSVAMPVFSRLQDQPFLFRKYYSKLVFILAALSMPLMAYLYVCSSEVIRIVFGEKWLEMDAVFKVLTLAGFIQVVSGTPGVVLLSLGQSRRYLQAGILSTIFTIISFIIGIQYGAIGVAKSYTVMSYVTVPAVFLFAFRGVPVHFFDFLSGMWRVCVACVFGGAVVIAVTTNLPEMSLWVALFVKGVLGGCVMIITLLLLPGGSKQLMLIWKLVKMNIYNKD
jgi:O-antigen/teichoic acid export membrane protein